MNYKIVESYDAKSLSKEVEELIKQDYKPVGGVSVTYTGENMQMMCDVFLYAQAMFKG